VCDLMFDAAVAEAAAGDVAGSRAGGAEGRTVAVRARPVARVPWLGGRRAVSVVGLGGLVLVAGVGGWAGSASQHGGVSLPRALGAAFNAVPAALVVLGVGTLAHGLAPRRAVAIAYGLVAWSFVIEMLGTTGTGGRLLLDLSVF